MRTASPLPTLRQPKVRLLIGLRGLPTLFYGTLMVLVDHPAWLHQINMAHKRNILQAVQQRFPHLNVKDISLRIG